LPFVKSTETLLHCEWKDDSQVGLILSLPSMGQVHTVIQAFTNCVIVISC